MTRAVGCLQYVFSSVISLTASGAHLIPTLTLCAGRHAVMMVKVKMMMMICQALFSSPGREG